MRHARTAIIGALVATAGIAAVAFAGTGGGTAGGPVGEHIVQQPAREQARAPRPAERVGITAAALTALTPASRPKYQVVAIRVSTRSRYWATATVLPRPAFRNTLPSGGVVLVRSAVTGRWTVVDLGTDAIGCAIAPISVLRDFGWASTCPPGDRL